MYETHCFNTDFGKIQKSTVTNANMLTVRIKISKINYIINIILGNENLTKSDNVELSLTSWVWHRPFYSITTLSSEKNLRVVNLFQIFQDVSSLNQRCETVSFISSTTRETIFAPEWHLSIYNEWTRPPAIVFFSTPAPSLNNPSFGDRFIYSRFSCFMFIVCSSWDMGSLRVDDSPGFTVPPGSRPQRRAVSALNPWVN